ncbi:hypothetical protein B0T19DRAFT_152847 [Cercophora scortea]|uniref:Uncharacterized protein n=1 Tax=Cercophora scortea TaxID=314031 RepID=A0AAE0MCV8_9PEZI|nr:hypothetical protein B0T19DRAFT_152847 [Cercophora scortea]
MFPVESGMIAGPAWRLRQSQKRSRPRRIPGTQRCDCATSDATMAPRVSQIVNSPSNKSRATAGKLEVCISSVYIRITSDLGYRAAYLTPPCMSAIPSMLPQTDGILGYGQPSFDYLETVCLTTFVASRSSHNTLRTRNQGRTSEGMGRLAGRVGVAPISKSPRPDGQLGSSSMMRIAWRRRSTKDQLNDFSSSISALPLFGHPSCSRQRRKLELDQHPPRQWKTECR